MTYYEVDNDRTWTAEEGIPACPQVVRIVSTDSPYLRFDFSKVLAADSGIASATAVIEIDSKTITISDTSVSNDVRRVSFKVTGMAVGDYNLRSTVTLNNGTGNTISRQGLLRVS